jgi:hypothetical protein
MTFINRGDSQRRTPMTKTTRRTILAGAAVLGATVAAAAQDKTPEPIVGKERM